MNYIKQLRYGFLLTALFVCAGTASAQGPVNNASTTTSHLAVTATFQSALQLDITTAVGTGVTIGGSAGIYTLDLGNVNGLGIGTPATHVTRTAVSGGFTYTTPIVLTPSFSGFAGSAAAITVGQNASDGAIAKFAAREGAAADSVAVLPAVASSRVVHATAANGTPFDRFIGVFVGTANDADAIAGVRTMNLVYTITMP
jgi:hypothetical protein